MKVLMFTLIGMISLADIISAVRYTIWVKTGNEYYDGTDDTLSISVLGVGGTWVHLGNLDDEDRNDSERYSLNRFIFDRNYPSWMVGKGPSCVMLFIDGDDAYRLEYVSVSVNSSYKVFRNHRRQWLSTDSSEGSSYMEICA